MEWENQYSIGRHTIIKIETGFLLMIWTVVHRESFKMIGERFELRKGPAHGVFLKACRLLFNIKKRYIKWPNSYKIEEVVEDFNRVQGDADEFPGIVGCIGTTHIRITAHHTSDNYINPIGYRSIQVQAVCDSNQMFTNVYVGWPGNVRQAVIWKNNPLLKLLTEDEPLKEEYHLIGSSAFPVSTVLVCPYTGDLGDEHKIFNKRLESRRILIDNTFSKLKNGFKRIQNLDIARVEYAKFIIMAPFIIYNFILSRGESFDPVVDTESDDFEEYKPNDVCVEGYSDGISKRDNMMKNH